MRVISNITSLLECEEFEGCTFENIIAKEHDLKYKYFTSSIFTNCDFSKCDITGGVFRNCIFTNCNLSLVNFSKADINTTEFSYCKLIGIDWSAIKQRKRYSKRKDKFSILFDQCILNYSIFIGMDLYQSSFSNCILKEVCFEDTDLECSKFTNSDLTDSTFKNSILRKADLSTAKNYNINANLNDIKQAKFSFPEAISLIYSLEIEILEQDAK